MGRCGGLHVGDRDDQLAVGVEDRGVGPGRTVGAGDVLDALVATEDAVFLPGDAGLRRATIQDVLTFTLREAAR